MSASPNKRPRIPEPEPEQEQEESKTTHVLESGQDIDLFINDDMNNVNVGDKIRITSLAQDISEESPTVYIVKNDCRKVAELLPKQNQDQDEDEYVNHCGKNKKRRENIRRKTNRVRKSTHRVRKTLRRRR